LQEILTLQPLSLALQPPCPCTSFGPCKHAFLVLLVALLIRVLRIEEAFGKGSRVEALTTAPVPPTIPQTGPCEHGFCLFVITFSSQFGMRMRNTVRVSLRLVIAISLPGDQTSFVAISGCPRMPNKVFRFIDESLESPEGFRDLMWTGFQNWAGMPGKTEH